MEISATELRQKLYRILDLVAQEGKVVTIRRKGKKIKLILEEEKKRSDRLTLHDTIVGDPETLPSESTSWEWNEERNLHGVP